MIITAQVLFFIKYYNPYTKSLTYVGHITEQVQKSFCEWMISTCDYIWLFLSVVDELFPMFRSWACLDDNIPLKLYEVSILYLSNLSFVFIHH
jgi:hypothetical protein